MPTAAGAERRMTYTRAAVSLGITPHRFLVLTAERRLRLERVGALLMVRIADVEKLRDELNAPPNAA
jgi:hypothetical protein